MRQLNPVDLQAKVPPTAHGVHARTRREATDRVFSGVPGLVPPYATAPRDSLTQIKEAFGDSAGGVPGDNAQVTGEDILLPGQVVFLLPGQVVFGPIDVQGASREQPVKPPTDQAAASAAGHMGKNVTRNGHPSDQALLEQLHQKSSESWSHLQSDIQDMFVADGRGTLALEDHAATVASQLDGVHPGDPKFAEATREALNPQTQDWQSLGVTHDQADPLVDAFRPAQSPTPKDEPQAQRDLEASYDQLKGSPKQKSAGMFQREGVIESVDRHDGAVKGAVVSAGTQAKGDQPAARVADAYRGGGDDVAAEQSRTQAQNAGAGYTSRIITGAAPTIDKATIDFNADTYASAASRPNNVAVSIVDDVFGAGEAADHHGKLGETKGIADFVAKTIAQHLPGESNLSTSYQLHSRAVILAVEGVISKALSEPKDKIGDAVTDFGKTDANPEQLRDSLGAFMTKAQLDRGAYEHAVRNPGFGDKFSQRFAAVQQNGRSVTQALQAYNAASDIRSTETEPAMPSYPRRAIQTDPTDAHGDRIDDDSAAFAVGHSGAVNQIVIGQLPGASGAEDGCVANPNPLPPSRAAQTFLDRADKHSLIALVLSKATQISLVAAGALLSAPQAASGLTTFDQLGIGGSAGAIYDPLGSHPRIYDVGTYGSPDDESRPMKAA